MDKTQLKPFAWGAGAGAVVLAIVLFATGTVVTSSSAKTQARLMSQTAVVDSLAEICVAQFEHTSDKDEKLSKLVATDSWKRGSFVSEQGWATMPGSDAPETQVASACAVRLAALQS